MLFGKNTVLQKRKKLKKSNKKGIIHLADYEFPHPNT